MSASTLSSPSPARLRRRVAGTVAAATVVGLGVSLAAGSATSASAAGTSLVWGSKVTYGTVVSVDDGDSVVVRVEGDSSSIAPVHIRNAGIQTMETGTCHAAEATTAMRGLVSGKRVRLSLGNPAASSMGRPVRYVDAWNGSAWVDTQLPMLKAGHALPMPAAGGDLTRWRAYDVAAQQAAKARVNLWDTDYCGSGPSQATPLRTWINWDGNLDESKDPNQEWVRILNSSATSMSLKGWSMRTAGQDSYFFPSSAVAPAATTSTLYVGKGTTSAYKFYWGSARSKFPNTNGTTVQGSGAYLFDPQGDLRAWSMYPCLDSCTNPLVGKVRLTVRSDATGTDATNVNGEWVTVRPAGAYTVNLAYTVISAGGHTYEFPQGRLRACG